MAVDAWHLKFSLKVFACLPWSGLTWKAAGMTKPGKVATPVKPLHLFAIEFRSYFLLFFHNRYTISISDRYSRKSGRICESSVHLTWTKRWLKPNFRDRTIQRLHRWSERSFPEDAFKIMCGEMNTTIFFKISWKVALKLMKFLLSANFPVVCCSLNRSLVF